MSAANVVMMGNIHTVDNPEGEGKDSRPVETKLAILIQFETPEDLRAAIDARKIEFTVFN